MDWFSVAGKYIFHLFIEPRERVHLLSIHSMYIGSWMICRNLYILNNIDKLSCSCPFHTIRDLPCLSGASIFRFILYVHLHWWWSFELKSENHQSISLHFMYVYEGSISQRLLSPSLRHMFRKIHWYAVFPIITRDGCFPVFGYIL